MKLKMPIKMPKLRLSVSARLIAGYLLVAAIVALTAVAGIVSTNQVSEASNAVVAGDNPRLEATRQVQLNTQLASPSYSEALLWDTANQVRETAPAQQKPDDEERK